MAGGGGKKRGGARWGAGGACPCAAPARRGVSGTRRCGLPSLSPACPAAAVPCGGARLFWSPAAPAFSFLFAPLPRRGRISPLPPLPSGKGGTKVIFMQGAPPLASPGLNPRGTCSPSPGGEDHLKRRSSSPPVPPLLGCRHCSYGTPFFRLGGEPWVQPRGCRGRSPRRNKLISPPLPTGEGGRGDRGQERKLKAGAAGDKEGKPPAGNHSGRVSRRPKPLPPRRVPPTPAEPATPGGKPPLRSPAWQVL